MKSEIQVPTDCSFFLCIGLQLSSQTSALPVWRLSLPGSDYAGVFSVFSSPFSRGSLSFQELTCFSFPLNCEFIWALVPAPPPQYLSCSEAPAVSLGSPENHKTRLHPSFLPPSPMYNVFPFAGRDCFLSEFQVRRGCLNACWCLLCFLVKTHTALPTGQLVQIWFCRRFLSVGFPSPLAWGSA